MSHTQTTARLAFFGLPPRIYRNCDASPTTCTNTEGGAGGHFNHGARSHAPFTFIKGEAMIKKGTKNVTVVLDDVLHRKVRIKAAEEGLKITEILRDFLKNWVNEK